MKPPESLEAQQAEMKARWGSHSFSKRKESRRQATRHRGMLKAWATRRNAGVPATPAAESIPEKDSGLDAIAALLAKYRQ